MKYFVFTDPHGNYEALLSAITKMGYDASNSQHQLVGCGDYFGRAAQSNSDCVNIWEYLTSSHHINKPICIRGNHESILIDAIKRRKLTETDVYNGENNTFASFIDVFPGFISYDSIYQFEAAKKMIDVGFYNWLKSLSWYFETEHYIFTHGFVPMMYFTRGVELSDFDNCDWERASWSKTPDNIRTFDLMKIENHKTIVFGHWRAKELNEKFALKWEEEDGNIYVDKERKLIGLDATTALSYKVGSIVIDD